MELKIEGQSNLNPEPSALSLPVQTHICTCVEICSPVYTVFSYTPICIMHLKSTLLLKMSLNSDQLSVSPIYPETLKWRFHGF